MKGAILVVALIGALLCSGYAQLAPAPVRATIPFDFVAGGTNLPAGAYEFEPTDTFKSVLVRNVETRKSIIVPILTRLGNGGKTSSQLTFDVLGDKKVLETMQPVSDDGYLFDAPSEKHTHQVIKID